MKAENSSQHKKAPSYSKSIFKQPLNAIIQNRNIHTEKEPEMTLTDLLKQIFSQEPMQDEGWSREQREAFTDLLLLGMYVDGKLSIEETDLLEKEIRDLSVETDSDWDIYVSKALHTVRTVEGKPEQQRQFLQEICERLGDLEKRHTAARELEILLEVDGKVSKEATFLDEVHALLGIRPLPGGEE
jgi:hypothetical protein